MAYEIINHGPATPARLHALMRLVARKPGSSKEDLERLITPLEGDEQSGNAVLECIRAASNLDLLETATTDRFRIAVPVEAIETPEAFRGTVTNRILAATGPSDPNYLLRLFAAWYAAQDDAVLHRTNEQLAGDFNGTLFPGAGEQHMNTTKMSGWRQWAPFLGYGWFISQRPQMIPDCHDLIAPFVRSWTARQSKAVQFRELVSALAAAFPELDGGALFNSVAQATRRGESNVLSMMLSTGLRAMHDRKEITLVLLGDAMDLYTFFPASGHAIKQVSHVAPGTGGRDV